MEVGSSGASTPKRKITLQTPRDLPGGNEDPSIVTHSMQRQAATDILQIERCGIIAIRDLRNFADDLEALPYLTHFQ